MTQKTNLVPAGSRVLTGPVRPWRFEASLQGLVKKLEKTMRRHNGVGIAANQIGVDAAVCLILLENDDVLLMVNPLIRKKWDPYNTVEGCLSLPGEPYVVKRYCGLEVSFQDIEGNFKELSMQDKVIAQRILHEIDHLRGVLINDYCEHTNCGCRFVENRKSLSIENVMTLRELKKDLGTGYRLHARR